MKKYERVLHGIPAWSKIMCLLFVTCIVYANSLHNPFHYDDFHSIVDNPQLRSWENIPIFFTNPLAFSVYPENAMYRPFLLVTFCLNHLINGYDPFGYHVVNLALHLGCILFLWGLGRQYLGRTEGVWVAVIFFAVHPINSESINYISSRSEILSGFFFLFSLWCYGHASFSRGLRILFVCTGYCMALLSKSIAISLPVVVIAIDLFMKRSILTEKGLKFALGVIAAIYIFGVRNWIVRATVAEPVRSFAEQFWTQTKALVFYIKMIIWPSGQNVDHQFLISDSLFDPISFSAFLFLVSVGIWLFYYRYSIAFLFLCAVCFLLVLGPSIVVPLNVLVNEHRLYLPIVFFSLGLGYSWNRYINGFCENSTVMHSLALIAFIALAVTTVNRNSVWNTSLSLWEDSAHKAPLMARPYIFFGEALEANGDYRRALRAYDHALTRDPNHYPLYSRMAKLFQNMGDYNRSREIFEMGLRLSPKSGDLWSDYAEVLREQGRWDDVLHAYLKALELLPTDDALHNNLGNTYQMLNRPNEAIIHHKIALRIDSVDARSWVNLGNAYMMKSVNDSSLMAFNKAVKVNESYAGAWLSLGNCLETLGRKREALKAYFRAMYLDPGVEDFVERREKDLNKGMIDE
ncbi:MAG: tetratricopeptide repeat protein [Candidatus Latescibacterota bacterium]|nr:tetratricopeptide repeat protein [Candidatus Latescibacterota bacterium]